MCANTSADNVRGVKNWIRDSGGNFLHLVAKQFCYLKLLELCLDKGIV